MARFRAFVSDDEDSDAASEASSSKTRSATRSPARSAKAATRTKTTVEATSSSSSSSSSSESEDEVQEDEDDDDDAHSRMEEDDLRPSSPEINGLLGEDPPPWAHHLDLEPHRMHVMQTSLFRMPELAKAQKSNHSTFLKHPRSTDTLAEPKEIPQRPSFTQPRVHPPARKYARISSASSIAASYEGAYVDAGLSFGRSFRIGWGPGDKIVHVGSLSSSGSSIKSSNTSVVNITKITLSNSTPQDLLAHLLSNSSITEASADSNDTPFVTGNRELTFSSFLSLFPPQDHSHTASVFRLGRALFDPFSTHLGKIDDPSIRRRIFALRRAEALSAWLSQAVYPTVEEDLKSSPAADSAKLAFLHMTGNQVEKAVDVLINGGNVRLATLISQVPGDEFFRADIQDQLETWRSEEVDALMSKDIRKLYALAAGEINLLKGSSEKEDVDILKGLDWLRIFGLYLWYSSSLDTPLDVTLAAFEQLLSNPSERISQPNPWYSEDRTKPSAVRDGLFNLIKLSLSPSFTMDSALNPLSFSENPRDFSIPWFLYVLISRCLRNRDFTDRQLFDLIEDNASDTHTEGASPTADIITVNFASQLEQEGLIQEATFVLLFLEDDDRRKRAIRELLMLSADLLDEWNVAGLVGSLKIPFSWIDEAKATRALYDGNIYKAYELFVSAKVHKTAHELAINYLAPEAILHDDLNLVKELFKSLDERLVPDFGVGGQLFIDYVDIVTRIPELRQKQQLEADTIPDAAEARELDKLSGRVPKLIGILPDVLKDKPGEGLLCSAALSSMLSRLMNCLDPSKPMRIEIQPGLVDEASRLRLIHSTAYSTFLKTIEALA